ncbi:hypothetical protein V1514DRAFT_36150 [Lipomyces japonicus]|uniref:uncharacterized protein n=1 Tax=Lipomyces japonicus TaxID=56871 RepID=UPI0034CF0FC9
MVEMHVHVPCVVYVSNSNGDNLTPQNLLPCLVTPVSCQPAHGFVTCLPQASFTVNKHCWVQKYDLRPALKVYKIQCLTKFHHKKVNTFWSCLVYIVYIYCNLKSYLRLFNAQCTRCRSYLTVVRIRYYFLALVQLVRIFLICGFHLLTLVFRFIFIFIFIAINLSTFIDQISNVVLFV